MRITLWAGAFSALFLLADIQPVWAMAKRPSEPAPPRELSCCSLKRAGVQKKMTLLDCYRKALERSEEVAMKREEIAKARADWFQSTAEAIGDGDFVVTDFLQDGLSGAESGSSVGSTLTATEKRERKFVFSQPLFQGFKSLGALAGAGSYTKQRKEEFLRAKELLFLDVSAAFYAAAQQLRDVETIEGIQALFQERVKELKEREKVGRSRPGEVASAVAKMKILEAQLAQARGALAIAGSVLEFYTGIPSGEVILRDEAVQDPAATLENLETWVQGRSDVEAAKQAMKTYKQGIVVAQSVLWPKITLDSNQYQKREGFQSGIDWDILVKINVPLFRGGDSVGKLKESVSDWKKARLNYSKVKREAALEIKEAYQNWISSREQDKAYRDAVKAAQENYNFQKEDYEKSLVNNLDVLSALEELFSTSKEANHVMFQMKQNYWKYQIAIGNCCGVPVSPANSAPDAKQVPGQAA